MKSILLILSDENTHQKVSSSTPWKTPCKNPKCNETKLPTQCSNSSSTGHCSAQTQLKPPDGTLKYAHRQIPTSLFDYKRIINGVTPLFQPNYPQLEPWRSQFINIAFNDDTLMWAIPIHQSPRECEPKKIEKLNVKLRIKEIWNTSKVLQWLLKKNSHGIEEFWRIHAPFFVCFFSLFCLYQFFVFWEDEAFNCFFFFVFIYIFFYFCIFM